jgi:hypothetical protein
MDEIHLGLSKSHPSMKALILKYIQKRPTATFANLDEEIPDFAGDLAMFNPQFPNVIVWPGMSEAAVTALAELMREGKIVMESANQLSYFIDGKRPNMPIALGFKAYKAPRWLPVCFSTKEEIASRPQKKGKQKQRVVVRA